MLPRWSVRVRVLRVKPVERKNKDNASTTLDRSTSPSPHTKKLIDLQRSFRSHTQTLLFDSINNYHNYTITHPL